MGWVGQEDGVSPSRTGHKEASAGRLAVEIVTSRFGESFEVSEPLLASPPPVGTGLPLQHPCLTAPAPLGEALLQPCWVSPPALTFSCSDEFLSPL